jgi:hypothetical protein
MNNSINVRLARLHSALREQDEIDRPASDITVSANQGGEDAATAAPGDGGADNPPDAGDTLDLYLSNIADLLGLEYDMDDSSAANFIYDVAEELASSGLLPEMPDDDAPAQEIAEWMGKAKSVQFAAMVLKRAREMNASV